MNKKPSFFSQANVLINRYFKIFFNDRQNLLLTIMIPLLTILIVCLVACPDMYSVKPDEDYSINEGYPVLNWETVIQVKENENENSDDKFELIQPEEVTVSKWDGSSNEAPGSPTKIDGENYFLITNANQLAFLKDCSRLEEYREYLTYNYILQVDIDLQGYNWNGIGQNAIPFTGTFDGNGHIIKNLTMSTDDADVGLFGYVKSDEKADSEISIGGTDMTFYHNGIVKNLQVQNVNIESGGLYTGAVVGRISDTARVFGVSVKDGVIICHNDNCGSIVGFVDGSNAEIHSCYSTNKIEAYGKNVGGLVGYLGSGRLSAAYSTSVIEYKGSKDEGEHYGAVVGNCDDYQDSLKNTYYDSKVQDKNGKYKALNNKDYKGYSTGVETEDLHQYASFLVPFKGIETAYDIEHPDEDAPEKEDNYNAEYDDSIDPTYGFKKDAQLALFGGTQTGLFMLVCVAIFVGICNSIQEICKERNILKREYMTNLSLGSYVVSKLVVQAVVCAVQMIVVILIFRLFIGGKQLPESGVIFSSIWTEYYITMFLLAFAADTMSLVISSIVKNSATANTFIPIILIVQIVFSGVLFDMSGAMDVLSKLMISKWGIAALAATSGLNDSQQSFLIENPSFQLNLGSSMSTVKDIYASTTSNLILIWGILLAFIVVCSIACRFLLVLVKKDER